MPKQIKNIINTNTKANKQRLKKQKTTPFLNYIRPLLPCQSINSIKKPKGDALI